MQQSRNSYPPNPKNHFFWVVSPSHVLFPPSLHFPFCLFSTVDLLPPLSPLVELRYHLELSKVAYKGSSDYIEVVDCIQTLQRLLGSLQDLQMLATSLEKRYGSLKKMPALAMAIHKEYQKVSVGRSSIYVEQLYRP